MIAPTIATWGNDCANHSPAMRVPEALTRRWARRDGVGTFE